MMPNSLGWVSAAMKENSFGMRDGSGPTTAGVVKGENPRQTLHWGVELPRWSASWWPPQGRERFFFQVRTWLGESVAGDGGRSGPSGYLGPDWGASAMALGWPSGEDDYLGALRTKGHESTNNSG